ncbi:MAG: thiamine-phosphate kinase [Bacteroidales bacterium]|jgi:thiamine-monophosphate kinase|nr:thiamine-phosphate kinase [Bacteroidales bacterium]MCK9498984.1 thiamine-phosphate kinase [Bacteroidales bacterium]MDY0314611.1 thiamine-phosphate kinase [Bacteroidales bacterium]NLB86935.1 thiamine-phosphate kinase [Bacteroidales bacterium]NLB87052.1 thiamine-phosphate kinase [Bacteroidales bacterium]
MKKNKLNEISNLGEFGLIDRLTKNFTITDKKLVKGVGDDAAVFESSQDNCFLIATDLLVEGIHFNLIYSPLKHLGYKAVVVNLSDIYAMNAKPKYITVSIAISKKFSVEALDLLYEGILLACERFDVELIGGDTTSSLSGLFINITVVGEARKEDIVYRSTAQKNDLICVSGDLGAAYMGLQILEREKEIFIQDPQIQPDLQNYEYIIERQLKPEPRRDIINRLKEAGIKPSSMIDVSDGLSSEILHLCKQSNLGAVIFEDKIPINEQTAKAAELFRLEPLIPSLNGGEDYELLFTIPLSEKDKIEKVQDISIIGYMHENPEKKVIVPKYGEEIELKAQGW